MKFLGLKIHWKDPDHPAEIRSLTSISYAKDIPTFNFASHPVRHWWGLSYNANWFFGFITCEKTDSYQSKEIPRKTMWSE